MNRLPRLVPALVTAGLFLLPALALASEEAGGNPWYDLVMKFVNFGILAGILFYFLRKPVSQALSDRSADIRRELEEARQAKEDAEARYQEYKEKVANLEQEILRIRADFKEEGEKQRQRVLDEATAAVESIRKQAEATGDNEVKRAQQQLRDEVAELAVELAEKLIAKAYTPEDQKKALAQTIDRVERIH